MIVWQPVARGGRGLGGLEGGPYRVERLVIDRESGLEARRVSFGFEALPDGGWDGFARVSETGAVGLTRGARLLSLDDGRELASLQAAGRLEVVQFSRDGSRLLLASRDGARRWRYAVHDSRSGEALAAANGSRPVMCYGDAALERVVVVGPRPWPVRLWQTSASRMELLELGSRGEAIFSPRAARWISFPGDGGILCGTLEAPPRRIELPAWCRGAGLRYQLGERVLALAVTTALPGSRPPFAARGELSLLAFDLERAELLDAARVEPAIGSSTAVHLDPTERFVLYSSDRGPCLWRIGSRRVHELEMPAGGRNGLSSVPVDNVSVEGCRGPWLDGGELGLASEPEGDGDEHLVAFFRLPE